MTIWRITSLSLMFYTNTHTHTHGVRRGSSTEQIVVTVVLESQGGKKTLLFMIIFCPFVVSVFRANWTSVPNQRQVPCKFAFACILVTQSPHGSRTLHFGLSVVDVLSSWCIGCCNNQKMKLSPWMFWWKQYGVQINIGCVCRSDCTGSVGGGGVPTHNATSSNFNLCVITEGGAINGLMSLHKSLTNRMPT